ECGSQGHWLGAAAGAGPPHGADAAGALPGRAIHVVADAAYAGEELKKLPPGITWTTRLRRDAALYDLPPARTGRRGRPRAKGTRLPPLDLLARRAPLPPGPPSPHRQNAPPQAPATPPPRHGALRGR